MSAASNPAGDRNGPGSIVCSFGLGGFGWSASKVKRVESAIAEVLKTKAKGVAALIAMGKALTEIKSQCEHGQFEAIVKLRVGISPSSARRAMQAHLALGNRDTCHDLDRFDATAVRMLSAKSTPPAVIERAISSAREGDHVTVYLVKNLLAESGEAKPKVTKKRSVASHGVESRYQEYMALPKKQLIQEIAALIRDARITLEEIGSEL